MSLVLMKKSVASSSQHVFLYLYFYILYFFGGKSKEWGKERDQLLEFSQWISVFAGHYCRRTIAGSSLALSQYCQAWLVIQQLLQKPNFSLVTKLFRFFYSRIIRVSQRKRSRDRSGKIDVVEQITRFEVAAVSVRQLVQKRFRYFGITSANK